MKKILTCFFIWSLIFISASQIFAIKLQVDNSLKDLGSFYISKQEDFIGLAFQDDLNNNKMKKLPYGQPIEFSSDSYNLYAVDNKGNVYMILFPAIVGNAKLYLLKISVKNGLCLRFKASAKELSDESYIEESSGSSKYKEIPLYAFPIAE